MKGVSSSVRQRGQILASLDTGQAFVGIAVPAEAEVRLRDNRSTITIAGSRSDLSPPKRSGGKLSDRMVNDGLAIRDGSDTSGQLLKL